MHPLSLPCKIADCTLCSSIYLIKVPQWLQFRKIIYLFYLFIFVVQKLATIFHSFRAKNKWFTQYKSQITIPFRLPILWCRDAGAWLLPDPVWLLSTIISVCLRQILKKLVFILISIFLGKISIFWLIFGLKISIFQRKSRSLRR